MGSAPPGLDGGRPASRRYSTGAGVSSARFVDQTRVSRSGARVHSRRRVAAAPLCSGLRPPASAPLLVRAGAGPADLVCVRHATCELPALRQVESEAPAVGGRQAAVDQGPRVVHRRSGAAAGGRAGPHTECGAGPGTACERAGIRGRFSRVADLRSDCRGGSADTRAGETRNSHAEDDAGATARECAWRWHASRHKQERTVCAGRLRPSDAVPAASVSSSTSADWKAILTGWPRRHRSRIARTVADGGNCGTPTMR